MSSLHHYRPWFYAAAIYNLIWGATTILSPNLYFDWIRIPTPTYLALWQVVIGMFVLVYAPAYWWAAQNPERHHYLIIIGLLSKLFGPIGFIWALATGQLPLAFGWTLLTNDIIWWPSATYGMSPKQKEAFMCYSTKTDDLWRWYKSKSPVLGLRSGLKTGVFAGPILGLTVFFNMTMADEMPETMPLLQQTGFGVIFSLYGLIFGTLLAGLMGWILVLISRKKNIKKVSQIVSLLIGLEFNS